MRLRRTTALIQSTVLKNVTDKEHVEKSRRNGKEEMGAFEFLAHLSKHFPVLTRTQEQDLFLGMNLASFAAEMLAVLSPQWLVDFSGTHSLPRERESQELLREAADIEELITRCNMRLIPTSAQKISPRIMDVDFFVSEATNCLLHCIRYFDLRRGNRFSTYVIGSIRKKWWRLHQRRSNRDKRTRFLTNRECADSENPFDALLPPVLSSADVAVEREEEALKRHYHVKLMHILKQILKPDEYTVFIQRIYRDPPAKFGEIAEAMDFTQTWAKQLMTASRRKFRTFLVLHNIQSARELREWFAREEPRKL